MNELLLNYHMKKSSFFFPLLFLHLFLYTPSYSMIPEQKGKTSKFELIKTEVKSFFKKQAEGISSGITALSMPFKVFSPKALLNIINPELIKTEQYKVAIEEKKKEIGKGLQSHQGKFSSIIKDQQALNQPVREQSQEINADSKASQQGGGKEEEEIIKKTISIGVNEYEQMVLKNTKQVELKKGWLPIAQRFFNVLMGNKKSFFLKPAFQSDPVIPIKIEKQQIQTQQQSIQTSNEEQQQQSQQPSQQDRQSSQQENENENGGQELLKKKKEPSKMSPLFKDFHYRFLFLYHLVSPVNFLLQLTKRTFNRAAEISLRGMLHIDYIDFKVGRIKNKILEYCSNYFASFGDIMTLIQSISEQEKDLAQWKVIDDKGKNVVDSETGKEMTFFQHLATAIATSYSPHDNMGSVEFSAKVETAKNNFKTELQNQENKRKKIKIECPFFLYQQAFVDFIVSKYPENNSLNFCGDNEGIKKATINGHIKFYEEQSKDFFKSHQVVSALLGDNKRDHMLHFISFALIRGLIHVFFNPFHVIPKFYGIYPLNICNKVFSFGEKCCDPMIQYANTLPINIYFKHIPYAMEKMGNAVEIIKTGGAKVIDVVGKGINWSNQYIFPIVKNAITYLPSKSIDLIKFIAKSNYALLGIIGTRELLNLVIKECNLPNYSLLHPPYWASLWTLRKTKIISNFLYPKGKRLFNLGKKYCIALLNLDCEKFLQTVTNKTIAAINHVPVLVVNSGKKILLLTNTIAAPLGKSLMATKAVITAGATLVQQKEKDVANFFQEKTVKSLTEGQIMKSIFFASTKRLTHFIYSLYLTLPCKVLGSTYRGTEAALRWLNARIATQSLYKGMKQLLKNRLVTMAAIPLSLFIILGACQIAYDEKYMSDLRDVAILENLASEEKMKIKRRRSESDLMSSKFDCNQQQDGTSSQKNIKFLQQLNIKSNSQEKEANHLFDNLEGASQQQQQQIRVSSQKNIDIPITFLQQQLQQQQEVIQNFHQTISLDLKLEKQATSDQQQQQQQQHMNYTETKNLIIEQQENALLEQQIENFAAANSQDEQ